MKAVKTIWEWRSQSKVKIPSTLTLMLSRLGVKDINAIKRKFRKDGSWFRKQPGIGKRHFNLICQMIGKYKLQVKYIDHNRCQMCGGELCPVRIQNEEGEWLFGYLCDCSEETRGK